MIDKQRNLPKVKTVSRSTAVIGAKRKHVCTNAFAQNKNNITENARRRFGHIEYITIAEYDLIFTLIYLTNAYDISR